MRSNKRRWIKGEGMGVCMGMDEVSLRERKEEGDRRGERKKKERASLSRLEGKKWQARSASAKEREDESWS
jgi:hypothetical protein